MVKNTPKQAPCRHRILLVITDLANGGAQSMNFRLAQALRSRGHQVDIAVLFDRSQEEGTEERGRGIKIFRLHADRRRISLPIRLAKFARSHDAVISGMDLAATNYGFLAALLACKPFASWMHIAFRERSSSMGWLGKRLSLLVYRFTPNIIFPSAGALDSLHSMMRDLPRNSSWRVIENFDVADASQREELPDNHRHIFSKPVVLSIGRLTSQKAYHRLLMAHSTLLRQGIDHNVAILGEGDQRSFLEAKAASLGVSETVFMPGHLTNVRTWIREATVFALCSEYEGLPLVLLEALHEGTAIVAMDCPSGPSEILDGGSAGKLTPPGDQQAFEAALSEMLRDHALRFEYAAAGKARASHYSVERILPLWEELLDDLSPPRLAPPIGKR